MVILYIQGTGRGFQCAPLLHLVDSNIISNFVCVESTSELHLISALRPSFSQTLKKDYSIIVSQTSTPSFAGLTSPFDTLLYWHIHVLNAATHFIHDLLLCVSFPRLQ